MRRAYLVISKAKQSVNSMDQNNLKPYPEYKDSGTPWLGKVPKHWDLIPCRVFFKRRNEIVGDRSGEYTLLSLTLKGVIKRDLENAKGKFPAEFNTYQAVYPNDFIFCLFDVDETPRGVGVSPYYGMITGAYTVFEPKNQHSKYLYYFFLNLDDNKALKPIYTGLRKVIPEDRFLRIKVPNLSASEQLQISRFLDYKSAQIAKFIKARRRMIELLKEKKQAIINDAVTGKIEVTTGKPYPKYKPSGVEWLGDVPEEWDVRCIKRFAYFNPSKSETGLDCDSTEPVVFLPMEKVSTGGQIDCNIKKPYKDICNGFSYFRRGDVVVAKITPCFENAKGAFLNSLETEYGFGTTEFITLRPTNKIHGQFLRLILSSKRFLGIGEKFMTGSAGQKRVSVDFIKNYPISVPSFDKQIKILEALVTLTNKLDDTLSRYQREIELMLEYRTSLIADVVTGKVDVRDIPVPEFEEETVEELSEENDEVLENEEAADEAE